MLKVVKVCKSFLLSKRFNYIASIHWCFKRMKEVIGNSEVGVTTVVITVGSTHKGKHQRTDGTE